MPHARSYSFERNLVVQANVTEDDCVYVCMPLFHAGGLLLQVICGLIAGARVHCVERFSPNRWLDEVHARGATITHTLSVKPELLHRWPETEHDADNNLRINLAVPVAEEWAGALEQRFGFQIMQAFGGTEISIIAFTRLEDPLVPGMAGHVVDELYEICIFDADTDAPMPQGEIGEIVIRPCMPFAFSQGYSRMPEKTAEAWRNLWHHTGDAGILDADGRLHFVDRIKDRIRRRGENISSYEIEQVLNAYPDIVQSAVTGIKVEGAGGEDEIKATLVAAAGRRIDNVTLLDYCADRISRYAVPRFLETLDELPKSATGKIQKEMLRHAGVSDETWDRESVGYQIKRRV